MSGGGAVGLRCAADGARARVLGCGEAGQRLGSRGADGLSSWRLTAFGERRWQERREELFRPRKGTIYLYKVVEVERRGIQINADADCVFDFPVAITQKPELREGQLTAYGLLRVRCTGQVKRVEESFRLWNHFHDGLKICFFHSNLADKADKVSFFF